jgi:hypothetical protein
MFVCSQCGSSFKNFFEKTTHTRHCSFNATQPVIPPNSSIAFSVLPKDLSPSFPLTPAIQLMSSDDAMDTVLEHDLEADTAEPETNWRGVPSSIPQSTPSPSAMLIHELQIARDVRKHELRQASIWTNKNYRILSQLINSLSLSQSDADRLLNAVILNITQSAITYLFAFIADSMH